MNTEFWSEYLPLFLALAAVLYGSVGHGGASSYIAIMALAGIPFASFKPAALCLNLVVAGIAWFHFSRHGWMVPRLTLHFLFGSIPAAMIGARITVPLAATALIISLALAAGAVRLLIAIHDPEDKVQAPPSWLAVLAGAFIGFLAGMAGIGGGVFLSPLLILARWASLRHASGICAVFIFCNSIAALLARPASLAHLPEHFSWWVAVVALGGWIGSHLGSSVFKIHVIRIVLSLVLFMAAGKLAWNCLP